MRLSFTNNFWFGSLIKVLLFQSLVSGMRATLHRLMATLTFSTKCGRRNRWGLDTCQLRLMGDNMLLGTNLPTTKLRYACNTCLMFGQYICNLSFHHHTGVSLLLFVFIFVLSRVAAFAGAKNDLCEAWIIFWTEEIKIGLWMVMRCV